MADVRLTATNPEDSSVVPVACNSKGELLLEEPIQGPPGQDGQDGAPGEQGPPGKDGIDGIPLPPDPYEGAILGWLNNGLAWIGTPPVPIPEGVFGPIISWSRESSYLEVEGPIPEDVGNGVYVYQCDERGDYFTEGWNTSQVWSDGGSGNMTPGWGWDQAFNGKLTTDGSANNANVAMPTENAGGATWVGSIDTAGKTVKLHYWHQTNGAGQQILINGQAISLNPSGGGTVTIQEIDISAQAGNAITSMQINRAIGNDGAIGIAGISVNGKILVDSNKSLSMRVNQVLGNGLVGVASADVEFSVGKYLFVPGQRVAPWVLYEGDPTSRIDYLRQTRD